MNIKRGLAAVFTSSLVLGAVALPVSAQSTKSESLSSQRSSEGGFEAPVPVLLTETKIDWARGSSEWVNLSWTSKANISDVQVYVVPKSDGLSIDYPTNQTGFTSLLDNDSLLANEIDFTSVRLSTEASSKGTKHASVYIRWTYEGNSYELYSGRLQLSNKDYKGDDFAIMTEEATASTDVEDADENWLEFNYKGLAPRTSNMKMTIESDLEVYHPQGGFTSLDHDETLHSGESDVARIWLDPELLESGEQELVVNITYNDANGKAKEKRHVVKLTIKSQGQA